MAQIDQALEEQIAARRSRQRQDLKNPMLIRDDGMLFPNTKLLAAKPRMRPYYGDPKATLDDRMRYLQGLQGKRAVKYDPVDDEPFDIAAADVDTLVQFALDQYGAVLDPSKPVKVLREQVFKLSQIPESPAASQAGLSLQGA